MAFKCAWCGSTNTQAGFDMHQCLNCGQHTNADGTKDYPQRELDASDQRGWVPQETYPEPDTQHPDRRRRPGDIPTGEDAPAPVAPEPVPAPEVAPVPEPLVPEPPEPTPEVAPATPTPEAEAAQALEQATPDLLHKFEEFLHLGNKEN